MHSTTPSGVRRIWPIVPSAMMKRELLLSSSLSASMVARMYSTVRSNSFCGIGQALADLPHDQVHDSRRRATICCVNSCMQAIRSATAMVGQRPRPSS